MAVSAKDLKKKLNLSEGRQAKISARAATLIEQELTLADLRRARRLTQSRIAKLLNIEQDGVSRMERRADMLLSTMASYIQAMGGKLRLLVEFPDREPVKVRLSDLSGSKARTSKKSASNSENLTSVRSTKTGRPVTVPANTKPEAIKAAKKAVAELGGGEIIIHGKNGQTETIMVVKSRRQRSEPRRAGTLT